MLTESIVSQWIGVDYQTIVYYHCEKCSTTFEKVNHDLYSKKRETQHLGDAVSAN
jgi:hypothetical protein